jgi:hypothetical protein
MKEEGRKIQSRDEENELNEFLYFINSETYRNQWSAEMSAMFKLRCWSGIGGNCEKVQGVLRFS